MGTHLFNNYLSTAAQTSHWIQNNKNCTIWLVNTLRRFLPFKGFFFVVMR